VDGLKKGVNLEGATVYTTLFPGNECAKMIANMDIAEVVYLVDKYKNRKFTMASKRLLRTKGVKYRSVPASNFSVILVHRSEINFRLSYKLRRDCNF